tara:strand:- start:179 stop:406 length:228 start_codon:yes stop_codon:yes gene_type:complete
MGLCKWILKKFKCQSNCTFNVEEFKEETIHIDLSKYRLKKSDMVNITKIVKKRPSIYTYIHKKKTHEETKQVTKL